MFPSKPSCEVCNSQTAQNFTCERLTSEWRFLCNSCSDLVPDSYPVELARFFETPAATVDWIAHLSEKSWMNQKIFADMMVRFRAATDSFNQS